MSNKEVIFKAVAFIESNLKADIDVFKVSREACYSLYHFIRLFQSITGFSPKNYIQQRRLTEAIYELRNTNKKIIEIAYEFQFGSHEAFSRAFRKQFHLNPTEIRNGHSLSSLSMLNPITPTYIYQSDKTKNTPPELVNLEEKILIGISFFITDDAEINDLSKEWARFNNEVPTVKHKVLPEKYYQIQYWSQNQELGGMYFFTGIEVSKVEDINPLFVIKTIPKGRYLKFIHKGFSNKVGYTYSYIYTQFLPDTNYKLTKP